MTFHRPLNSLSRGADAVQPPEEEDPPRDLLCSTKATTTWYGYAREGGEREMATMQVQYIKWKAPARGQVPRICNHSYHRGGIQRRASQAKGKNLATSKLRAYFAGLWCAGTPLYSTDFNLL